MKKKNKQSKYRIPKQHFPPITNESQQSSQREPSLSAIRVVEKTLQKDVALARSYAAIEVIGAQARACYDNAWRLFLAGMPEIFIQGGRFVEGWFVFDLDEEVVLNEHGWCETSHGTIIDPSVLLLVTPSCPVYYFSGVRRRWNEVADLVYKEVTFPYVRFDEYGDDGMGHPGYRAAYEAACRKVEQLGAHTNKKKTYLRAQDIDPHTLALLTAGVEVITLSPSGDPDELE